MKRKLPSHEIPGRKPLGRKLEHTLLALAASSAVFAVLLLAGTPAMPTPEPAPAIVYVLSAGDMTADVGEAIESESASPGIDVAAPATTRGHRSISRTRALLALPYFSFAQGLRHTGS